MGLAGAAFLLLLGIGAPKARSAYTNTPTRSRISEIYQAYHHKVAVIDIYNKVSIDIDGDKKDDLTHGEFVELIMKVLLPSIHINRFDVGIDDKKHDFSDENLKTALQRITNDINNGIKYDAVNISLSYTFSFDFIQKQINKDITKNNIHRYSKEIRQFLNKTNIKPLIDLLEEISSAGIPIYVSNANNPEKYNILGVAKGVKLVHSLTRKGEIEDKDKIHSDIQKYGPGDLLIETVLDNNEIEGYDINGDGKSDIPANNLSAKGSGYKWERFHLYGNSFASPVALIQDLLNKSKFSSEPLKELLEKLKKQPLLEPEMKNIDIDHNLEKGLQLDCLV